MSKTFSLITDDNIEIIATLYNSSNGLKGGVIINSATAVKQSFYTPFAEYLSSQGYIVITYDYRGIGQSKNSSKQRATFRMQDWGSKDLKAVIEWTQQNYEGIDWHCIGHSVGGQIIGFADNNHKIKSFYCVSSQSGYWGHWQSLNKLKVFFMWHLVVPTLTSLVGKIPGAFIGGESLPGGIAKQWAYWGRNPDYIVDDNKQPIRNGFNKVTAKMQFLHIDDDPYFAPKSAVLALAGFYQNANVEVKSISHKQVATKRIGHFGFFKNKHNDKDHLWLQVISWFAES